MKTISRYWYDLTHIGTDSNMSYLTLKRVHMVNLIALVCAPSTLFFTIVNFVEGRQLLAAINCGNFLCAILVILLQHLKKHNAAKAILLIGNFIFFTIGALLFRNGSEYFILCILIASMLVYDSRLKQSIAGIAVIIAIIAIYAFDNIQISNDSVPRIRALFNITGALTFILIAINFFKKIIYNNTKKIEQQRIKLLSMNRDKEKIFSILAHDIRSPYVALEQMVALLREQVLSKDVSEEFINQLHQRIIQQNLVLEDLLRWSSQSMLGIRNKPSSVSIRKVLEEILRTFEAQSGLKGITFNLDINILIKVFADWDHLIIIFRNLISNAIKFSHTGGIIRIYATADHTHTSIHIQDHGVGMQPDKSQVLFKSIQGRSVGTQDEPGAGLGLVLCKDLIERNNGIVSIESMPSKGSIFSVSLPSAK